MNMAWRSRFVTSLVTSPRFTVHKGQIEKAEVLGVRGREAAHEAPAKLSRQRIEKLVAAVRPDGTPL
jgi:hypothetical protein